MTVVSPGLVAYLTTNREFMAPAVADAITSLDLREGARILDVGTGGGGALPPLVTAAGSSGTVLAVDLDPGVIALARKHAELAGVGPRITFQVGDTRRLGREVRRDLGERRGLAGQLRRSTPCRRDDGRCAARRRRPRPVHEQLLPVDLPARVLTAGTHAAHRIGAALEAAGGRADPARPARRLAGGRRPARRALRVQPRIGFPAESDPTVRAYLESAVWPELLESARLHGPDAGCRRPSSRTSGSC